MCRSLPSHKYLHGIPRYSQPRDICLWILLNTFSNFWVKTLLLLVCTVEKNLRSLLSSVKLHLVWFVPSGHSLVRHPPVSHRYIHSHTHTHTNPQGQIWPCALPVTSFHLHLRTSHQQRRWGWQSQHKAREPQETHGRRQRRVCTHAGDGAGQLRHHPPPRHPLFFPQVVALCSPAHSHSCETQENIHQGLSNTGLSLLHFPLTTSSPHLYREHSCHKLGASGCTGAKSQIWIWPKNSELWAPRSLQLTLDISLWSSNSNKTKTMNFFYCPG